MTDVEEEAPPLPRIGLPVLAYIVALAGAIYAINELRPRGLWLALTVAVPVLALVWMVRVSLRYRRRGGGGTPSVQRAYLRRFVPLILAYVVLLAAAIWLHDNVALSPPLAVAVAILPALPLIGVIWAMGRMIADEPDEYLRALSVRQFLVATGFMLAICCVWGFLETFGLVAHLPLYWAFVIWCAGLGVGSLVNELKR